MDLNNIIEYVCVIVCSLHAVIGAITSLLQGKKINKICEICQQPVFDGQNHVHASAIMIPSSDKVEYLLRKEGE